MRCGERQFSANVRVGLCVNRPPHLVKLNLEVLFQLAKCEVAEGVGSKYVPIAGTIHATRRIGHERVDMVSEDELCVPSLELSSR